MEAHEHGLGFLKTDLKLEIPYFQRSYVWTEQNWEELFENLIDKKQSHFLGSIILKRINTVAGEISRFSVIDGQQRLTTLSILLKACYDNFDLNQFDEEIRSDVSTKLRMMLYYKKNELSPHRFVKIIHSRLDRENYDKVINGQAKDSIDSIVLDSEASKGNPATESGILKCYKYFHNRLKDTKSASTIWEILVGEKQNFLVKIDLDSNENEQAIFDSVNSSGVRLTIADTIKNSIFQKMMEIMSSDTTKVIDIYTANWENIFAADASSTKYWASVQRIGRINRDNLELLLHSVALIKQFFDPEKHNITNLAEVYKNYIAKLNRDDLVNFVKEIADYGKIYRKVFTADREQSFEYCNNLQRLIHILNVCDISTLNPYILFLLKKYSNDSENLLKELKDIETMVLRYTLCKVSNKNFNKSCALFIKDNTKTVKDEMISNKEYINNRAIENALRNITNNKIATVLLFWIELYRRSIDSKHDIKDLKYSYSLEHIMPQSWEQNWGIDKVPVVTTTGDIVDVEETAIELRRSAIYEIGNMTLLNRKLNSSLSNKEMKSKIEIMDKYAGLGIAREVIETCKNKEWNECSIRNRTNELNKLFIELWPFE